jgi:hypothetical protein
MFKYNLEDIQFSEGLEGSRCSDSTEARKLVRMVDGSNICQDTGCADFFLVFLSPKSGDSTSISSRTALNRDCVMK